MKNNNLKYLICLIVGILLGWFVSTYFVNKNKVLTLSKDLTVTMEELTNIVANDLQKRTGEDLDTTFKKYLSAQRWGLMNLASVAMDNSKNVGTQSIAEDVLLSQAQSMQQEKPSVIDKSDNTRTLKYWEIPDYQMTDNGMEVVGFYKNGKLYKISYTIGLSWGLISTDYYFDEYGVLTYVYEKKEFFPPLGNEGDLNHERLELAGEGKYYFTNNKLVKTDIKKGKYFANAGDVGALNEETLLSDSKKYIEALSR